MSPLWRDEIGLFLAPKRIVLARMKRGIRPVHQAERNIAIDTRDALSWESALATLENCLDDDLWQNANARVVIADNWARYAIVPWSDDLSDATERVQHARICMANTFGEIVSNWTVTVSDAAPGLPQVACAIPSPLLSRIREMMLTRGVRIKSVQPHLIAAFNGWRGHLPRGDAWFVALDEGTLAAAHFNSSHWDCVRSVRIGTDWETELKRLQTFGRLARTSDEDSRVYVDAPGWLRDKAGDFHRDIEWLVDEPGSDGTSERFALLQRMYA